jgi:membrane protein DedA with SNARE-associated domain
MAKFLANIISYSVWSLVIGLLGWLACKVNGTVVNYWSVVLATNCIYLLAAPFFSAAQKE